MRVWDPSFPVKCTHTYVGSTETITGVDYQPGLLFAITPSTVCFSYTEAYPLEGVSTQRQLTDYRIKQI